MFQMTVEDAMVVNSRIVTVAGPCIDMLGFKSRLLDEHGNVYTASIPLDATLVFDNTRIVLELSGTMNAEALIGRTLYCT